MYYLIAISASCTGNAINDTEWFDAAAICTEPAWPAPGLPLPVGCHRTEAGYEVEALACFANLDDAEKKLDRLFSPHSERTTAVNPESCTVPLIPPQTILVGRRALPLRSLDGRTTARYIRMVAKDHDLAEMHDRELMILADVLENFAEQDGWRLVSRSAIQTLEKMRAEQWS